MNTDNIRIVEDSSKIPLCPHCGQEIRTLQARKVRSKLGVRFLYFCDQCRKVLGISHRKGFWMG